MSDENDNRPGRPPITLKPRTGSVSAGVVKQSFSHGRTKTVVVETKRQRTHSAPAANLAGPSAAERRPAPGQPQQRPQGPQGSGGLSADEMRARQAAIESAQRQAQIQAAARAEEARKAAAAAEAAKVAPTPAP
ncbi:MAG: translation initiation factor IF-2 associated domain-containing protein, partial [Caulobacter sp.]|nr:translation initiation factor IF-2 associated domain-containing protein [Caulobacter sp.]